ncbi:MAG: transposase [Planctomycetaceae bacterium]|nr:transposase [Planctomycetaceae bacterium]
MYARMPEQFYEEVNELLPQQKEPGLQGGRRPVPYYTVLKVIWFVLVTGCRWNDVPLELGCCGEMARTRRQAWEEAEIWDRIHRVFLTMLRQQGELDTGTAIIDST